MVVKDAVDIGTSTGLNSAYYRIDMTQGNASDTSFRNGQFWNVYAYTGKGNPTTDPDPANWKNVFIGQDHLTPKDDLVAGMGKGEDYIVMAVAGGPKHVILDLSSPFTSTPTTMFYDGSRNPGEPTFGEVRTGYETSRHNCFVRGTMIATPRGEIRIEDLVVGDLVTTADHGPQPIRWIGSTAISAARFGAFEKVRPIRIAAGALGNNYPETDLMVSPQHRILIRSRIAEKMFGATEVLVAAKQLLQVDGVEIVHDIGEVEYFHMLFDRHEIVMANGAAAESLYTGPEALKSISAESLEEIYTLFPELRDHDYTPTAARVLVSGRQARHLAVRHINNHKPLVAA